MTVIIINMHHSSSQSMDTWGMLDSTEAYNLILGAVVQIPAIGAHYTTFNDMIAGHIDPNLDTFHLLLDGTLAEGSVKNTKKAAYYLWRSVMKEWPRVRPDVDLVNKFIRCCLVCGDHERGLVFLAALSDCSVEPNTQTFTLLLKVRLRALLSGLLKPFLPSPNGGKDPPIKTPMYTVHVYTSHRLESGLWTRDYLTH